MLPKSPKLGKNFTKINVPEDLADSEIGFVGERIVVVDEPTNIYKPLIISLEISREGTLMLFFIKKVGKKQSFVTLTIFYFYLLNVFMINISYSTKQTLRNKKFL